MNRSQAHDDEAQRRRSLLSDLADGQCRPEEVDHALRAWGADDRWRQDWRAFQLIGDALRSDELASQGRLDRDFLQALRGRLATEPVPLSPAPLVRRATAGRSWHWKASAAAIAGFAVVGASVFTLRPAGSDAAAGWGAAQTAVQAPAGAAFRVGTVAAPAASGVALVDVQVIRDARLDAYFEAHRGVVGPAALPGGAMRSVDLLLQDR